MKDWPLEERPKAFIYEEVNYPEGMFSKKVAKKVNLDKRQQVKRFMQDLLKENLVLININI